MGAVRAIQRFTMVVLLAAGAVQSQSPAGGAKKPAAVAPVSQGIYTGTLGNQEIVLEIGAAGADRDKELRAEYIENLPIEGRYFYRRHGVGILLEGEPLGDGSVRLKEYVERKASGAEWKISFRQGSASGFFCKCDVRHAPESGGLKIALTRVSGSFDPTLVWPDSVQEPPDQKYYDLLLEFPVKTGPEVRVSGEIAWVERSDPRFSVKTPRLTRFPDPAVMNKINRLLDSHFRYYRLKSALAAQGEDFGGGDLSEDDSVKFLSRDFLSLLSVSSSYSTGALHPENEASVAVYDMRTAEPFDFKQFFLPEEEIAAGEKKSDGEDESPEADALQRALGRLYLKFNKNPQESCDESLMRSSPQIDTYFTSEGMALLSGHARECGDAVIVPYSAILPLVRKDNPFRLAVEKMMSTAGGDEAIAGDWRGPSTCLVKPSACNDEDSLYHFAPIENKSGWVSLQADKIVEGKPVNMGTPLECSHATAKHSLECKFPRGVIEFVVEGKAMRGTMKLTDGTPWRKISLKKVE